MDAKTAYAVGIVKARRRSRDGSGRQIRIAAGLSLQELATPVGCHPATIHRWETGSRAPHGDAAIRWADVLEELNREAASAS